MVKKLDFLYIYCSSSKWGVFFLCILFILLWGKNYEGAANTIVGWVIQMGKLTEWGGIWAFVFIVMIRLWLWNVMMYRKDRRYKRGPGFLKPVVNEDRNNKEYCGNMGCIWENPHDKMNNCFLLTTLSSASCRQDTVDKAMHDRSRDSSIAHGKGTT